MLRLAGIQVEARSIGGIETCIQLPQFHLGFDLGRCPKGAVNLPRIFLTHTHIDHAATLIYHASMRELLGMNPPTYYVPHENLADVEELFRVWRRLDRSDIPCQIVGVGPGETVVLSQHRRVEVFRAPHRVTAQGYAVINRKQKLRAEFLGLPEAEIIELRKARADITETVEQVDVAFTGDSVIDVVDQQKLVRTARLLVMEVTFLDETINAGKARVRGHIHLDDVIARAHLCENEHILFTHFSARYGPEEIRKILAEKLPESLKNRVTPLLGPGA
jgi:ribonuclease Z